MLFWFFWQGAWARCMRLQRRARYTGGLWVGSFVKVCTHQWMDQAGVAAVAPPAMRQSTMEGNRRAAALRQHGKDW